jgi:hypothetical protein
MQYIIAPPTTHWKVAPVIFAPCFVAKPRYTTSMTAFCFAQDTKLTTALYPMFSWRSNNSFTFSQETINNTNIYPYNILNKRAGQTLPFSRMTMLYGDNGCGKSTILNVAPHNRIAIIRQ